MKKPLYVRARLHTEEEPTIGNWRAPAAPEPVTDFPLTRLEFSSNTVAQAIGVEPPTLLSWRRKYNLLVEGPPIERGGGFKHSVIAACLYKLMAAMVEAGIPPKAAAWYCGTTRTPKGLTAGLLMHVAAILGGEKVPEFIAFRLGGNRDNPRDPITATLLNADDTLRNTGLAMTVIDLRECVFSTLLALNIEIVSTDKK